jgi:hypothetical protein
MVSPTIATTALNLNQKMTDFDYKKYSLENLENWMHDAMSAGEATPQEIYDVIVGVVKENYYIYKQKTSEAYELLALLNGNDKNKYEDYLDKFLNSPKEDKVVKWQLPVQVDGLTGDCYINLPDDLLEAANLKEGDQVQWIDRGDGSFEMRKITEPLGMDEC